VGERDVSTRAVFQTARFGAIVTVGIIALVAAAARDLALATFMCGLFGLIWLLAALVLDRMNLAGERHFLAHGQRTMLKVMLVIAMCAIAVVLVAGVAGASPGWAFAAAVIPAVLGGGAGLAMMLDRSRYQKR
jgi:hypothetical protein